MGYHPRGTGYIIQFLTRRYTIVGDISHHQHIPMYIHVSCIYLLRICNGWIQRTWPWDPGTYERKCRKYHGSAHKSKPQKSPLHGWYDILMWNMGNSTAVSHGTTLRLRPQKAHRQRVRRRVSHSSPGRPIFFAGGSKHQIVSINGIVSII